MSDSATHQTTPSVDAPGHNVPSAAAQPRPARLVALPGDLSDDGARPLALLGAEEVPLTRDGRPDTTALATVRQAIDAGRPVTIRLHGLTRLDPAPAGRLVDWLTAVVGGEGAAPGGLDRLFDELARLDPGPDPTRSAAWRDAAVRVGRRLVVGWRDAVVLAERIAVYAQVRLPRHDHMKTYYALSSAARRRNERQPPEPVVEPDPTHAAAHPDSVADLVADRAAGRLWSDASGAAFLSAEGREIRLGSGDWVWWVRGAWAAYAGQFPAAEEVEVATVLAAALARSGPDYPIWSPAAVAPRAEFDLDAPETPVPEWGEVEFWEVAE